MIRRFIGMMIFTATITLASFGQDVFGREDLIHLAKQIQQNAPAHASAAMKKTDIMLNELTSNAGVENADISCVLDDLEWSQKIFNA